MLWRTLAGKRAGSYFFKLDKILDAYETFGHAAGTGVLKGIIEA